MINDLFVSANQETGIVVAAGHHPVLYVKDMDVPK